MSDSIVLTTEEKLKGLMRDVLNEHENRKREKRPPILYSINKVAKMTHSSHSTIKKKVKEGVIKSTKDGLISEDALNEYLLNL